MTKPVIFRQCRMFIKLTRLVTTGFEMNRLVFDKTLQGSCPHLMQSGWGIGVLVFLHREKARKWSWDVRIIIWKHVDEDWKNR